MTSDSTNEINSGVSLQILDSQDWSKHMISQNLGVKLAYRGRCVDFFLFQLHFVPLFIDVETECVFSLDNGSLSIFDWLDVEALLHLVDKLLGAKPVQ